MTYRTWTLLQHVQALLDANTEAPHQESEEQSVHPKPTLVWVDTTDASSCARWPDELGNDKLWVGLCSAVHSARNSVAQQVVAEMQALRVSPDRGAAGGELVAQRKRTKRRLLPFTGRLACFNRLFSSRLHDTEWDLSG